MITIFQNTIGNVTSFIANIKIPNALRGPVLRTFSRIVNIDPQYAENDISSYTSINDFFTRRLHSRYRPIASDFLVHPVDGTLIQCGNVHNNTLIQAKGITYTLTELLDTTTIGPELSNAAYLSYYLSPSDCHLIMAPCDGIITNIHHVTGAKYPVRDPYLSKKDRLYCRNERKIITLNTEKGPLALVCIAAFNVGDIDITASKNATVKKGDAIAKFKLGSSVVMLYSWPEKTITTPQSVTFGAALH